MHKRTLFAVFGQLKMKNSDIGRIEAGVLFVRDYADYIIKNDYSIEAFYEAIDNVINQTQNF